MAWSVPLESARMLRPIRHAVRMLRKNPGFSLVAICSLAIGIGATSASFSIADVLLLRPLPVLEPSRVVAVTPSKMGAFGADSSLSYPDYKDFRDTNRSFDGLVASGLRAFGFSPDGKALPKTTYGTYVSGNFFQTLGVQPALGRGFLGNRKIRRWERAPWSCWGTISGSMNLTRILRWWDPACG